MISTGFPLYIHFPSTFTAPSFSISAVTTASALAKS